MTAKLKDDPGNKKDGVSKIDPSLLDAFLRLYKLSERKEEAAMLSPIVLKEIHLRLLMGPLGRHLCGVNTPGNSGAQISKAVSWLRAHYKEPLEMDGLSSMVNMSPASFYRHFKRITSLSPLQYQKRLRLYEANRLMLVENENAANAAYAVGYESLAQFVRDYKELFGLPPLRDIKQLHNASDD